MPPAITVLAGHSRGVLGSLSAVGATVALGAGVASNLHVVGEIDRKREVGGPLRSKEERTGSRRREVDAILLAIPKQ